MKIDIKTFIQSCIHCIISGKSKRIPCSLSTALHCGKPNEEVQPAFICTATAGRGTWSMLVVTKEAISSYTWSRSCKNGYSDAATTALERCTMCFSRIDWLVADKRFIFKVWLMETLPDPTISNTISPQHISLGQTGRSNVYVKKWYTYHPRSCQSRDYLLISNK